MKQLRARSTFPRAFWMLLGAESASSAGSHFRTLTVTVVTFQLTGSIFATALQFVVNSLPGALLWGIAGNVADRVPIKRTLVLVNLISAAVTLLYIPLQAAWLILVLNFVLSALGVLIAALASTWLPTIIARKDLLKANGTRTAVGGIVDLIIPALAGLVIVRAGTDLGFAIDSLSFIVAAACVVGIGAVGMTKAGGKVTSASASHAQDSPDHSSVRSFLGARPDLLLILVGYALLVGPSQGVAATFFPFLSEYKGFSDAGYGLVISAFLLGNLSSGIVLSRSINLVRSRAAFALVLAAPLTWFLMPTAPSLLALLGLVFVHGSMMAGALTALQSLLQSIAPPHLVGRTIGVMQSLHFGAEVGGALIGALLAQHLGFTLAFPILAAASATGLLGVGFAFRQSLEDGSHASAD